MRTTDLVSPSLSYRQIEHWISQGYVPGTQTFGSGTPTMVTDEQADWLATMGRLVQAGFRPARAAEIIAKSVAVPDGTWRGANTGPDGTVYISFTYGRNTQ